MVWLIEWNVSFLRGGVFICCKTGRYFSLAWNILCKVIEFLKMIAEGGWSQIRSFNPQAHSQQQTNVHRTTLLQFSHARPLRVWKFLLAFCAFVSESILSHILKFLIELSCSRLWQDGMHFSALTLSVILSLSIRIEPWRKGSWQKALVGMCWPYFWLSVITHGSYIQR